jgi:hypothetical protein
LTLAASVMATFVIVMWPRVARAVGYTPPPPEPAYRAGQTIDAPAEWRHASSPTLMLFAQSACGACQKAKPFLKALFDDVHGRAAVVLATHGPNREEEAKYAVELGLASGAIKVTPKGLRVQATPTLVLVDPSGKILEAWQGVGPEKNQQTIRDRILQLTKNN